MPFPLLSSADSTNWFGEMSVACILIFLYVCGCGFRLHLSRGLTIFFRLCPSLRWGLCPPHPPLTSLISLPVMHPFTVLEPHPTPSPNGGGGFRGGRSGLSLRDYLISVAMVFRTTALGRRWQCPCAWQPQGRPPTSHSHPLQAYPHSLCTPNSLFAPQMRVYVCVCLSKVELLWTPLRREGGWVGGC